MHDSRLENHTLFRRNRVLLNIPEIFMYILFHTLGFTISR